MDADETSTREQGRNLQSVMSFTQVKQEHQSHPSNVPVSFELYDMTSLSAARHSTTQYLHGH